MTHTVFVYGTLKSNKYNNSLLENSEFLGNGITKDPFLLVHDSLPYLIKKNDHEYSTTIKGEIYEVDDEIFKKIDKLEGHPYFYKRGCVIVKNEKTNEYIYSWCYFVNDITYVSLNDIIKNGEWDK